MRVRSQRFKVIDGFLDQTKFEHQYTMIEPADEMVWIKY